MRRRYLVAYDIREDKRLRRVHKTMKAFGYPLQYSVFICDLSVREKFAMKHAIGRLIEHLVDSIAIIDLGDPRQRGVDCFEFMGCRAPLPEDGPLVL